MKKIFLLFVIALFSGCVFAQTKPIVIRHLGVDSVTGLNQDLAIWGFNVDAETEIVRVKYKIHTISPTGVIVISETKFFDRYNRPERIVGTDTIPADLRFNALRNSQIGKALEAMLSSDADKYPNIEQ